MSDPQLEQGRAAWRDTDKYHRDTLEPIRRRIDNLIDHTVEYGRVALRTALELNGGGKIALPSLGTLFGSIFNYGHTLPVVGVLSFLFGLLMAAGGYACAFFHFMEWQYSFSETYSRKDRIVGAQIRAILQGKTPPNDDNQPTPKETRHAKRARRWQAAAIAAALLSLLGFIAGALITAFVLAWQPLK